jgi:plasmid maintenance system antidote protein VapI
MSIWAGIESEFTAIVNDARSIPEKLAALVDLHSKAQSLSSIESTVTAIVDDATRVTADKVTAIMQAVGKL